jgi:RNA polymerase sigma-70 factor (sigma-E family)
MVAQEVVVIGREVEFEDFVATYGDRLLHAAYGLCGDWQHAEDLVQQALAATATRWDRIGDNRIGYAYRCLTNARIDRWRRLGRRQELSASPELLASLSIEPATGQVENRLVVAAALQALPPRQRAIVVLRYLQDLPETDVAAVLGISTGAVKSGASRALARLRAKLDVEETR